MPRLLFLSMIATFLMASCGGGNSSFSLLESEEYPALKELITEKFGSEKEINSISFYSEDDLTSKLRSISIIYRQNDSIYTEEYLFGLTSGAKPQMMPLEKKAFLTKSEEKSFKNAIAINDLDLSLITRDVELLYEAIESPEMKRWALRSYSYGATTNFRGVDEGMQSRLKYQYVPDGSKTQLEGRQLVTNFYEVIATV